MEGVQRQNLIDLRRELHAHPEVGWTEFRTTSVIADRLRELGYDVAVGPEAVTLTGDERRPDEETIEQNAERAVEMGVNPELVDTLKTGGTGVVGTLKCGEGPVVGLRIDIDALPIDEATTDEHRPAEEGFGSNHSGEMHACGHDGHITLGLGVAERFATDDEFNGTIKLFFQPSEEGGGGGQAMVAAGHLSDVDRLVAVHLALGEPTGTVVSSVDFLSVSGFTVDFSGSPAHSAAAPEEGHNALLAAADAAQNVYAVPRHAGGDTRVNIGELEAGSGGGIIPADASMSVEMRARTDEILEHVEGRVQSAVHGAAETHGVDVSVKKTASLSSAVHDEALAAEITDAVADVASVDVAEPYIQVSGSEDAVHLIRRVRETGGDASYMLIGADIPSGHHTDHFDFDEDALSIGVDALTATLKDAAEK